MALNKYFGSDGAASLRGWAGRAAETARRDPFLELAYLFDLLAVSSGQCRCFDFLVPGNRNMSEVVAAPPATALSAYQSKPSLSAEGREKGLANLSRIEADRISFCGDGKLRGDGKLDDEGQVCSLRGIYV